MTTETTELSGRRMRRLVRRLRRFTHSLRMKKKAKKLEPDERSPLEQFLEQAQAAVKKREPHLV